MTEQLDREDHDLLQHHYRKQTSSFYGADVLNQRSPLEHSDDHHPQPLAYPERFRDDE
jgi:hypothetical protein